jgi:hypothetical protein
MHFSSVCHIGCVSVDGFVVSAVSVFSDVLVVSSVLDIYAVSILSAASVGFGCVRIKVHNETRRRKFYDIVTRMNSSLGKAI